MIFALEFYEAIFLLHCVPTPDVLTESGTPDKNSSQKMKARITPGNHKNIRAITMFFQVCTLLFTVHSSQMECACLTYLFSSIQNELLEH
jgi:hypothetical protein